MKLREKTKKKIRGSVTILLVIILLPMMTFSALIVDLSRINMAKQMMSSAGDLTMNTALANYDTILKDVYGLFAMSQGKTNEQLGEELNDYFANTLTSYGVVDAENSKDYVKNLIGDFTEILADTGEYRFNTTNFIELQNVTLNAQYVKNSNLGNASILRNQIVEYMKFRAPLEFGMSFLDALKSFDVVDDQMKVIEAQVEAQESTQDVTHACAKLIKLIRQYDEKVESLDASVTGVDSSTDGKNVYLKDYSTHVNKYLSAWAEDYTHINLLNMIFLAKAPSKESIYLVKLNYAADETFVKSGGTGLVYENSGINLDVTTAGTTEEAKNQVDNQISSLNTNCKPTADSYVGKSYIDESYLTEDRQSFGNEEKAIDTFIEYEKFLLDQAEIKYSTVANILEQLYTLGKYYDNYYSLKSAEVDAAYDVWQEDLSEVNRLQNIINNFSSILQEYLNEIDENSQEYAEDSISEEGEIACLKDCSGLQTEAVALLGTALPELSSNYEAYYNTYLTKYRALYTDIVNNATLKKSEGSICEAAKDWLSDTEGMTFRKYMEDKVNNLLLVASKLDNLLECLNTNMESAEGYYNTILEYKTAKTQLQAAQAEENKTKNIYETLVQERTSVETDYETCLKSFYEFVRTYQGDAFYYGSYITTATNIVDRETAAVDTQFGQICDNIKTLRDKLEAISTQCGLVDTAITEYYKLLTDWEKENTDYISSNGADSFSKQTNSDVKNSQSDYDLDSLRTLKTLIDKIHSNYKEFYTYLTEDVYFKYGGKRLHEIASAEDAKAAASSTIEATEAAIITPEIAATNLTYLYKDGPGHTFIPYTMEAGTSGQLKFLEPILQLKFLKYLNSAYPEETDEIEIDDQTTMKPEDVENDYKTSKDKLKGTEDTDNGTSESDDETSAGEDRYGYSYASVDKPVKSELPSGDTTGKTVNYKEYKLKESTPEEGEEYGDIDAKSGVSEQKSAITTVLSGLGNVLKAGIENAYILSYIFENFSYNTMIQDAVSEAVEKEGDHPGGTPIVQLQDMKNKLKDTAVLEPYVDKLTTLSNIPKKAGNNYFYGAEIEYIMYGNVDPVKNVTYAKASIYGIRFAFNCIYAFTNTEIRNTTMTAGLAVQAATLGIVPYQVVQIILQLALAAAESAVDLEMMMCGLDVALVKSRETWSLSLETAVHTVSDVVTVAATDAAQSAINKMAGGLQAVVDATAEELTGAIMDLQNDLQKTTRKAVEDIIDSAFGIVMEEIEAALNELQYIEETAETNVKNVAYEALDAVEASLEKKLEETFAGNDLAQKVMPYILPYIPYIFTAVKTKINSVLEDNLHTGSSAVELIIAQMTDIKLAMVTEITHAVEYVISISQVVATDALKDIQNELNSYITEASGELSEEVAAAIKDKVTAATDDFVGNFLGEGTTTAGTGKTSMASLIKFGYEEYLMLFVYISICVGGTEGNGVIMRTADVIELNIQHAQKGLASYTHARGADFEMTEAYTYLTVTGNAELDMFFLDMDLFASVLEEPAGEAEEDVGEDAFGNSTSDTTVSGDTETALDKVTKLVYKGLLGY